MIPKIGKANNRVTFIHHEAIQHKHHLIVGIGPYRSYQLDSSSNAAQDVVTWFFQRLR